MNQEVDEQLEDLRRRVIERITNVFTSKPTWSAMPFVDIQTHNSIEQAVNDEFEKHKSNTTRVSN